jgi:HEPN domain-containing protein
VGRTHNPAWQLRQALAEGHFAASEIERVRALVGLAEMLGADIHIQTDYGDEIGGRTPWELFDEEDARRALQMAEEAFSLAEHLIGGGEA